MFELKSPLLKKGNEPRKTKKVKVETLELLKKEQV